MTMSTIRQLGNTAFFSRPSFINEFDHSSEPFEEISVWVVDTQAKVAKEDEARESRTKQISTARIFFEVLTESTAKATNGFDS